MLGWTSMMHSFGFVASVVVVGEVIAFPLG